MIAHPQYLHQASRGQRKYGWSRLHMKLYWTWTDQAQVVRFRVDNWRLMQKERVRTWNRLEEQRRKVCCDSAVVVRSLVKSACQWTRGGGEGCERLTLGLWRGPPTGAEVELGAGEGPTDLMPGRLMKGEGV